MIVICTADLARANVRGRRALAPTSGWWCPNAAAHLYLERVLGSTAVCGRVSWSTRWHPEDLPKKALAVVGSKLITMTVQRILLSEGFEYDPEALSWVRNDPLDVLRDTKRRAEAFWADPKCAVCDIVIKPDDEHWWRHGTARCGVCDLAYYLLDFMVKGRTEREIERRLRGRKLTFKRHRNLIEEALARTGARKARNGIWVPRAAQEDAA
jgi:hypothetical protein